MKLNLAILCALLAGIWLGTGLADRLSRPAETPEKPSTPPAAPRQNEPGPAFSFTDINGKSYRLADFAGKNVVLNFWASWCPPCIKEFPLLLSVAARNPDNTILIALSSDHEPEAMMRFLGKLKTQFPDKMALDNVVIARDTDMLITQELFQTLRLPETVVIGPDGRLSGKIAGADWRMEDLEALLK